MQRLKTVGLSLAIPLVLAAFFWLAHGWNNHNILAKILPSLTDASAIEFFQSADLGAVCKGADQVQRSLPAATTAPAGFTIYGDHATRCQCRK